MMKEHDRVGLREEVPDQGLKGGDVGTVIDIHKKGEAYEVEFVALDGETLAIATLAASQIRSVQRKEITHARLLRA